MHVCACVQELCSTGRLAAGDEAVVGGSAREHRPRAATHPGTHNTTQHSTTQCTTTQYSSTQYSTT